MRLSTELVDERLASFRTTWWVGLPRPDRSRDDGSADWNNADLRALVHRLRALTGENEWLEFKVDNSDPDEIGEYISCLSNSAALAGQESAFLLWGVTDDDHELAGTTFRPHAAKVGNEDLYPWLLRLLDPHVDFSFHAVDVDGVPVVVLRIDAASKHPVKFKNVDYVRIGSYKKKLTQHSDHQRRLWRVLDAYSFEDGTAAGDLSVEGVVQLLDYPAFFTLMALVEIPQGRSSKFPTLGGCHCSGRRVPVAA